MYRSSNQYVQNNQLKIQELVIRSGDTYLLHSASSNSVVYIGERIDSVTFVLNVPNGGTVTTIAASAISVVNSSSYGFFDPMGAPLYTDGNGNGTSDAVLLTGFTLAANAELIVRYVVNERTFPGYISGNNSIYS